MSIELADTAAMWDLTADLISLDSLLLPTSQPTPRLPSAYPSIHPFTVYFPSLVFSLITIYLWRLTR
ncbi:hypothetical protein CPC08DRAFT_710281 [Agrocybe pediades]|nr:hypothetical protein CPC08DRAFT_710281 [Agrocybe pediades]